MSRETWLPKDNKDDIEKAVRHLHKFTKNWCLNVAETKRQDDLVFRCDECEFREKKGKCTLKVFKSNHLPNYKDFGSMGDL